MWHCSSSNCVSCTRSGVTRCTLLMVLYLDRMWQCGIRSVLWCTSVYSVLWLHIGMCAASLLNHAVPQDFYSSLSVPLERSCWPCIRWCGTGGFQEQGQCFFCLSCSIPTIVFYFSLSPSFCLYSIGWYCGAGFFGLIGCLSLSLSLALLTSFNNNNNLWYTEFELFALF